MDERTQDAIENRVQEVFSIREKIVDELDTFDAYIKDWIVLTLPMIQLVRAGAVQHS